MSDVLLNQFVASGTSAERVAFTPDPPTAQAGPDHGYIWYETDTGDTYAWNPNGSPAAWELASSLVDGITQLTGDVTAGPGTGSQAATIANGAVTNAKAADMAQATIKGRASGAGTGDPTDLTPDQASTVLDAATDPFVRTSAAPAGYTDEQAQDAVGGILSDSGDVDFTYNDGSPTSIVASLKTTSTPQVARLGIGTAADASAKLTVAGQFWIPLVDDGNSGASKTIDWDDGNEHLLTLTDDCDIDAVNPKDGGRYVLVLYTGAGGFAPTFPADWLWPGGAAPTITVDAGKYDLITLLCIGSGSPFVYLASINQNYG